MPNLCFPGKAAVAETVAKITGKEMGSIEEKVAVIHCARVQRSTYKKYEYFGHRTCSGANLAFAGPTDCQYGCVGFGECADACLFDAITMVNEFPVINEGICVGCGICIKACPKDLISMVPKIAKVVVRCSSKDSSKVTHSICSVGCLHCLSCVRECPAEAVSQVDGVIRIDHNKCMEYGPSCNEACVKACFMVNTVQPFHKRPLFRKEDDEITAQEALAL